MAPSLCPQCRHPLVEGSRFCGQCGTVTPLGKSEWPPGPAAPPADPVDLSKTTVDASPRGAAEPAAGGSAAGGMAPGGSAAARAQRTMVGFAMTEEQIAAVRSAQADLPSTRHGPPPGQAAGFPPTPRGPTEGPGAPASTSSPPIASIKGTMLGVAVGDALRGAGPPLTPATPGSIDPRKGTMLGVAVPGIAPLSASVPSPPKSVQGTMMGVAIPGVAPTHGGSAPYPGDPGAFAPGMPRTQPRRAVEIAPMPPPLVDDEPDVGPAPHLQRRGVPLGLVAGIAGIVAAIGGVVAFLFLRSPPLIAQPRLDAQGHEELHLTCESCQDGTTAELFDARATFKNKEADLALGSPLKVGNNPLTIVLDRPKLGRDESVHVVVPVAFRIRADLAELTAARPAITVRVEALAGTDVKVDVKPVTLDAAGDGTYSVDIGSETEGPADELRMIDRVIPYAITPKAGEPQVGKLTVRVGIAPLHLDAPGLHAVVEGSTFRLTGRTLKGASVTANGTAVHVEPDGTFAQPFDITSVGDLPVEVRGSAPQLAPRIAHFVVKRVEHLADEAKSREAQPEATYDDIAADLKAAIGKSTIVEGDVVEARTTAALTVAVIDDTRGCTHAQAGSSCLVRVTYGGDTKFKHGDALRAYGRVTRVVPYGGSTVPEVEADFVQLGHAPKR
jgi:hypothetical protein